MAGADLSFLERIRGKRTRDIDLPPGTSTRDPRLPEPGGVRKAVGRAAEGFKTLREKGLVGKRSVKGRR